ncbi:MAG: hypothetical protein WKF54_10515 [Nocardioidaceae bacterium]
MPTEKSITVQRDIPASATEIFAVLSNPAHHVELDGSGFVQGVHHADRITGTGQSFRMNMSGDHMGGDYQTDNVVSGFEPGKLLAWKTAPAGTEPPGWEWVWELDAQGPNSTSVSLTYDWEKVTDSNVLSKVSFPLVSEDQLDESLSHLAEAVSSA